MGKRARYIKRKLKSSLQKLAYDGKGQDLIEYAMLAGFMAVAAAAVMPSNIASTTSTIFSKLNGSLISVGQGS